jgi:hypothetical protein
MTVSLTQTKVNAVNEVSRTTSIGNKVGRLDIAMDQMPRMHNLDTFQHLIGNHQHSLETEPTPALVELILQTGTQQIHDHEIVRILRPKVMDLGEPGSILELAVHLVLVTELGASGSVLLELDGDFFPVGAHAEVDVAEGTATDSFGDAIFGDGGLHCFYILFIAILE